MLRRFFGGRERVRMGWERGEGDLHCPDSGAGSDVEDCLGWLGGGLFRWKGGAVYWYLGVLNDRC